MEYSNGMKKKFAECVENGIELDKEGHALLRMEQRKISFDADKKCPEKGGKMAEKIAIDYDEEFDDLYVYRKDKKLDFRVNLGDRNTPGHRYYFETSGHGNNKKRHKRDKRCCYNSESKKNIKLPIVMPAVHA